MTSEHEIVEEVFEVESILAKHTKAGNTGAEFLIRWVGYGSDDDTWEPEHNLNCKALLAKFEKRIPHGEPLQKASPMAFEEVFEVESILDKHTTAGNTGAEFLIRWVGYGSDDDTWEPEHNLNCKALLAKFEKRIPHGEPLQEASPMASAVGKRKRSLASRVAEAHKKSPSKQRTRPGYSVRMCSDRRFGRGVFALADIPADTFLFEYTGERVAPKDIKRHGGDVRYFWSLSDGTTVDSSNGGNASRYLNHFKGANTCCCCHVLTFTIRIVLCRSWRGPFSCC